MSEFSLDLPGILQYNTGIVILNLLVGAVHSKNSLKKYICLRKIKYYLMNVQFKGQLQEM